MAVIDPKTIDNLDVFWQLLASPGHTTIVHAGREEFRFCKYAIGERPAQLVRHTDRGRSDRPGIPGSVRHIDPQAAGDTHSARARRVPTGDTDR